MIDILIKSFNRPYYLDRCLQSIIKNVSGNYKITVMDDGTPEIYLKTIQQKFPEVKILKSKQYQDKIEAIDDNLKTGKAIDGFQIPTQLWINQVKKASDYFIITEDDVWFTNKINVDELYKASQNNHINLIKLGWLGNDRDNQFIDIQELTPTIDRTIPKNLFLSSPKVMEAFFYNQYKFYSILYKLGRVNNDSKRAYLALNSILMGFYAKTYWLEIWNGMELKVDEKKQVLNATNCYRKNKNNKNFVARLKTEVMKTTFKSSATGSYHEYGNHFDVNRFNQIINDAWVDGSFDAMENYPNDFSDRYIKQFLDHANHKDAQYDQWFLWAEQFRNQYRNIGAKVD